MLHLISTPELAAQLGLAEITLRKWRVYGSGPRFVRLGGSVRYRAEDIDAWLAQDLTQAKLSQKPFSPLPMLGLPGWWPANEAAAFYDDVSVFRPQRRPLATEKPHATEDIGAVS